MYAQCEQQKKIWKLSVGHARGREVSLDPLSMTPAASDKKHLCQTSSRSYSICYKHRSIKSIDYRQASPRVAVPNFEMRNPVHRTVFAGLWKDQVGVWYCRNKRLYKTCK